MEHQNKLEQKDLTWFTYEHFIPQIYICLGHFSDMYFKNFLNYYGTFRMSSTKGFFKSIFREKFLKYSRILKMYLEDF